MGVLVCQKPGNRLSPWKHVELPTTVFSGECQRMSGTYLRHHELSMVGRWGRKPSQADLGEAGQGSRGGVCRWKACGGGRRKDFGQRDRRQQRPGRRRCRDTAAVARARAGTRRRDTRSCACLVRQRGRGLRAGRRRDARQRTRRRRHLPLHGQSGQHASRLPGRRAGLVRLVRPARPPSPARLRPGCRRLSCQRTRPQALPGNPETAPGGDPLLAPRRRLPGADRRCLRLGDHGRHYA